MFSVTNKNMWKWIFFPISILLSIIAANVIIMALYLHLNIRPSEMLYFDVFSDPFIIIMTTLASFIMAPKYKSTMSTIVGLLLILFSFYISYTIYKGTASHFGLTHETHQYLKYSRLINGFLCITSYATALYVIAKKKTEVKHLLLLPLTSLLCFLVSFYSLCFIIYGHIFIIVYFNWFWIFAAGMVYASLFYLISVTVPKLLYLLFFRIYKINSLYNILPIMSGTLGLIAYAVFFGTHTPFRAGDEYISPIKVIWEASALKTMFVGFEFIICAITLFASYILIPVYILYKANR